MTIFHAPPPKASSAEINTGTNDVKFITPAALAGSNIGTLALSSLQLLDYQVFDSSGTWTKPTGAQIVHAFIIGGGGGGGSGRKDSTGTRFGGEGGCPGGAVEGWFDAADLSSSETVTVGAGGNGAASRTSTGNGNNATSGSESTFAGAAAGGGRLGRGGTSTGPTSTPFTPKLINGGTSLLANPSVIYTSGSVIPDPDGGHVGAGSHGDGDTTGATTGGAPGAAGAGGLQGNPGDDGASSVDNTLGGSGGGGGNGVGAAAGDGGTPGGGGGGGGYGDGSTNSGAGGDGGDGRIVVITWG